MALQEQNVCEQFPILHFATCYPLQVVTNCKNTVQGFKRFHGRAFSDPYVQAAKSSLVYDLAEMPSGSTGIKVGLTTDTYRYLLDIIRFSVIY